MCNVFVLFCPSGAKTGKTEDRQKGLHAMTTSTGRAATASRHRRHHPYDTPFHAMRAPAHVPAPDRTGNLLFLAISAALMAAVAWAGLVQLIG